MLLILRVAVVSVAASILLPAVFSFGILHPISSQIPQYRPHLKMFSLEATPPSNPECVVIAGAGIMGCSTAYYLAKLYGISSVLVDPTGSVAPAASGKAGGFLALDWNDYGPVGPLARRGFHLHQQLANDLGGPSRVDYRRLSCAAISVSQDDGSRAHRRPKSRKLEGIEWAEGDAIQGIQPLGDENTIAQVHPLKLCQALWEETQRMTPNSKLMQGAVTGAVYNKDGNHFRGARLDGGESVVPGDALLYACGPWTANVMTGVKYHSVVVPTPTVLSQCVFFSGFGDPEVYVREDQTAYCTGFPDDPVRVTEQPGQEEVRPEAIAKIEKAVQQASQWDVVGHESATHQACYLPSTPDGIPIIGDVPSQPKCYVATGHTCWGILTGPSTGEAMAHLLASGTSPEVDLAAFSPARIKDLSMVPTQE